MQDSNLGGIDRSESIVYQDSEVIFEENSLGKEIYIIEDGKVEISQIVAGRKMVLAELKKGASFGEMAPITCTPRSSTAIALGRVSLISFSIEEMMERMKTDNVFMQTVLQKLIDRLQNVTLKLNTLNSINTQVLREKSDGRKGIAVSLECCENLRDMISHLGRGIEQRDKQIGALQSHLSVGRPLQTGKQSSGKQNHELVKSSHIRLLGG